MVASPQNDFVALASNNDNHVYVVKSFSNGERTLVQAWTKWDMPGDVQIMTVVNDTWFMISRNADNSYVLSIAPIDQLAMGKYIKLTKVYSVIQLLTTIPIHSQLFQQLSMRLMDIRSTLINHY